MFGWLARALNLNRDVQLDNANDADRLLWTRDLERHTFGEFSFAVVQANPVLEDFSQVETGRNATFVGVYDGHGGPQAAHFTRDHLFNHFINIAGAAGGSISLETLRGAVASTEEGFMTLVHETAGIQPLIRANGTCCLVAVISQGTLYVANLGDSRAVLGRLRSPGSRKIVAEQITEDHNACWEEIRNELRRKHPDDQHIVLRRNKVWRVKGIIQITRSIGDAYLKNPEDAMGDEFPRYHLEQPLRRPALESVPALYSRALNPVDRFVVFASDGLWELLSNKDVVKIVHKNPRESIARRLIKAAVVQAAWKRGMKYRHVKQILDGSRRTIHDDISVVVVFFDQEVNRGIAETSMYGFSNATMESSFNRL